MLFSKMSLVDRQFPYHILHFTVYFFFVLSFIIFEVMKAYVASLLMHPQTIHYMGNGAFMVSDKSIVAAYCCCCCNIDAAENKEINSRRCKQIEKKVFDIAIIRCFIL